MGEGRRWTFTDFKFWLEEDAEEKEKKAGEDSVPSHWPAGVELDGKRLLWLPPDWGQGSKISMGGNKVRVFISPEGKIYHSKRDVEKEVGRTLEEGAGKDPETEKRKEKREKSEAPPRKDWPEWLPLDWTMGMAMSAGTLRPRYYNPTGQGFFNRGSVEAHVQKLKSSPAANSPSTNGAASPSSKRTRKKDAAGTSPEPKAEVSSVAAQPDSKSGSAREDSKVADTTSGSAEPNARKADPPDRTGGAEAKNGSAQPEAAKPEGANAAAAPDRVDGSPQKRPRLDGASTDDEVEKIGDGEPGDGYALRQCRAGAAWLVLPSDVISLDLKAIGGQVEAAGWSCSAREEQRWSFTGSPDLVLYHSGKLLVRSGQGEDAGRIAKQFVDSWLALEE